MPDILKGSPADALIFLGHVVEPIIFLNPLIEVWGKRGSWHRPLFSWGVQGK